MNKQIKLIILLTVFILPVGILFFLHGFGENKFAIPIQHQQGVQSQGCPDVSGQYTIPEFTFQQHNGQLLSLANFSNQILVFGQVSQAGTNSAINKARAVARLLDRFRDEPTLHVVLLANAVTENQHQAVAPVGLEGAAVHFYFAGSANTTVPNYWNCGLRTTLYDRDEIKRTPQLSDLFVLVDRERRIRGYYNIVERQEADRLIDEIRVLIQEYDQ